MLVEYTTSLADKKLKPDVEDEKRKRIQNRFFIKNKEPSNKITYVEKLVNIEIKYYRKNTISLIVVPYFANVLRLPDEESYNRTRDWILNCHGVKRLYPSISFFEILIEYEVERAKRTGIKPLKFKMLSETRIKSCLNYWRRFINFARNLWVFIYNHNCFYRLDDQVNKMKN